MSMILRVQLDYSSEKEIRSWTKEKRDEMRTNVLSLRKVDEPKMNEYKDQKTGEDKSYEYFHVSGEYLVTEEEAAWLRENNVEFNIKDFKNNYKPSVQEGGSQYHYHLPNIGLLLINEVKVLEDSCTEFLQEKLDEGYRIIAVCPPNGARRPDYILGRTRGER